MTKENQTFIPSNPDNEDAEHFSVDVPSLNMSVLLTIIGGGLVVDIYPLDEESEEPLASTFAFTDEAIKAGEGE